MSEIDAHGLTVDTPPGWEGRIFRRGESGDLRASEAAGPPAPEGARTFPLVQVATVPVPADAADYASDIVDELGPTDALIVIKEFDPALLGEPLFERVGMPRVLAPTDFDTATLQRSLAGQGGHQTFFNEAGRAFCLYVVLGGFGQREQVVPRINEVLATVEIGPADPDASAVAPPPVAKNRSLEPTESAPPAEGVGTEPPPFGLPPGRP